MERLRTGYSPVVSMLPGIPITILALVYESTVNRLNILQVNCVLKKMGKRSQKKTIRVNDPLERRGYVIYQSSYDREAGNFLWFANC